MKRFKLPVGALIVLCHILDVRIIIACNSHCMYEIIFVEILQELDHHPVVSGSLIYWLSSSKASASHSLLLSKNSSPKKLTG